MVTGVGSRLELLGDDTTPTTTWREMSTRRTPSALGWVMEEEENNMIFKKERNK